MAKFRFSWKRVGHRLRVTRLALGLTDQEAATAHGVTVGTYRKWEAGGQARG
jgi:transcriptional regulator with XRE-family HTH domain